VFFESFGEFLAMGGHGLYVWLSYGFGLFILMLNILLPLQARKRLLIQQVRRLRREEARS